MSSNPAHTARRRQLIDWLRERLSESVQLPPEAVRSDLPLSIYGVDSLLGVMMLTEIEDGLGVLIDPDDVPPAMTLDDLAELVLAAGSNGEQERSDAA